MRSRHMIGLALVTLSLSPAGCEAFNSNWTLTLRRSERKEDPFKPASPLRLSVNGRQIASLDWDVEETTLTPCAVVQAALKRLADELDRGPGPSGDARYYVGDGSVARLEWPTPEGWAPRLFCLSANPARKARLVSLVEIGEDYKGIPPARTVELLVDHRGEPGRLLSCGRLEKRLAPTTVLRLRIPSPRTDPAAELKLDGQAIGSLPAKTGSGVYVIDSSGKRSYRLDRIDYSDNPYSKPSEQRFVPQSYAGMQLHELSSPVSYFLERAPSSIRSPGSSTWVMELTEQLPP